MTTDAAADGALFLALLVVVIVARLSLFLLDRGRIDRYLRTRRSRLIRLQWSPFGPGWFGTRGRIYRLRYTDARGSVHDAYAKTSLLSGVYFTEDRTVKRKPPRDGGAAGADTASLEEENRRLRSEIRKLTKPDGGKP